MKDENFIRKADYAMLEQRYGLCKYYPCYVHNPLILTPVLKDLIIDKPLYADANRRKKKRQELARERQMMEKLEMIKIEERQRDRDRQRALQKQEHPQGLEFRNPFGDGKLQVMLENPATDGLAELALLSHPRLLLVFSKRHHLIALRFISFVRGPSDGDEVTPPSLLGLPLGLEITESGNGPTLPLLRRSKLFDQTKLAQTLSRMKGVFKKKLGKIGKYHFLLTTKANHSALWIYRANMVTQPWTAGDDPSLVLSMATAGFQRIGEFFSVAQPWSLFASLRLHPRPPPPSVLISPNHW